MSRSLIRQFERSSEALAFAGVALLSVAIATSIVDIVGRKTIGFSVLGINDINQLLVMACVSLAMPFTFVREGHVGVDFLTDALPKRALATLRFVVDSLCAAFLAALAYFAFRQATLQIGKGDTSLTLGLPIVIYWIPLLLGLAISAVATLLHAWRDLVAAATNAIPAVRSTSPE